MNKHKTSNKTILGKKGQIFVLSGPSGSGKTTLHEKLLSDPAIKTNLFKTISATTRKPRAGEKDKRDYLFLSLKTFLLRAQKKYFLEWQKVFGDFYGTPRKPVETLLQQGKNVLLCIDVQGAKEIFRQHPQAIGIFVKTRNVSVLKKRLYRRGSESPKRLAQRLTVARQELKEEKKYCYVVINDKLSEALKGLKKTILKEILNNQKEERFDGLSTVRKTFTKSR